MAATYEMRAEHLPSANPKEGGVGPVKIWHMVRNASTTALCGRDLEPDASTRSEDLWGATGDPFCHSCGALYLREVP